MLRNYTSFTAGVLGALPYAMLVEPVGKIVYAKQGTIDATEMKTLIVENKFIGRFY